MLSMLFEGGIVLIFMVERVAGLDGSWLIIFFSACFLVGVFFLSLEQFESV